MKECASPDKLIVYSEAQGGAQSTAHVAVCIWRAISIGKRVCQHILSMGSTIPSIVILLTVKCKSLRLLHKINTWARTQKLSLC